MELCLKTKTPEATQPATRANAITFDYFCLLGGAANKNTAKVSHFNARGDYTHHSYHLIGESNN